MALSNWDLLAFDHLGNSCDGQFKNIHGNVVEIYKNFLYIHSDKMWKQDGSSFTHPVIAQMSEGFISLAGFEIYASRGPQNAVFCLVVSQEKKDGYNPLYSGGIGCYGYENDVEVVLNKLNRSADINDDWISGSSYEDGVSKNFIENLKTREVIIHDYETEYCGVKPSTFNAYIQWVKSLGLFSDLDAWVKKIEGSSPQRFNQGDKFFSDNLNIDLNSSQPGLSDSPVLEKLLKPKD